jgi:hypothetical protein
LSSKDALFAPLQDHDLPKNFANPPMGCLLENLSAHLAGSEGVNLLNPQNLS